VRLVQLLGLVDRLRSRGGDLIWIKDKKSISWWQADICGGSGVRFTDIWFNFLRLSWL